MVLIKRTLAQCWWLIKFECLQKKKEKKKFQLNENGEYWLIKTDGYHNEQKVIFWNVNESWMAFGD